MTLLSVYVYLEMGIPMLLQKEIFSIVVLSLHTYIQQEATTVLQKSNLQLLYLLQQCKIKSTLSHLLIENWREEETTGPMSLSGQS